MKRGFENIKAARDNDMYTCLLLCISTIISATSMHVNAIVTSVMVVTTRFQKNECSNEMIKLYLAYHATYFLALIQPQSGVLNSIIFDEITT